MCLTARVANDASSPGDQETLSLQELAERSALPARTIRWYQSEGLLPKPGKRGRDAVYRAEHLERLALIAELRDRGITLVTIRDLVSSELPLFIPRFIILTIYHS